MLISITRLINWMKQNIKADLSLEGPQEPYQVKVELISKRQSSVFWKIYGLWRRYFHRTRNVSMNRKFEIYHKNKRHSHLVNKNWLLPQATWFVWWTSKITNKTQDRSLKVRRFACIKKIWTETTKWNFTYIRKTDSSKVAKTSNNERIINWI